MQRRPKTGMPLYIHRKEKDFVSLLDNIGHEICEGLQDLESVLASVCKSSPNGKKEIKCMHKMRVRLAIGRA